MEGQLEAAFEGAMHEGSLIYQKKTGTRPTRYLQMIDRLSGVGAAAELALYNNIQSGLQKAAEYDCIELTSEYLIVEGQDGRFATLFTDNVIKAAKRKLKALYEYRDILKQAGLMAGSRSRKRP